MLNEFVRKELLGMPRLKKSVKSVLRGTYTWQHQFIWSRGELPFVLNTLQLLGTGAEIGVRQGTYSRYLLMHWHGAKLYSIDPWQEEPDYLQPNGSPMPQAEHDSAYRAAVRALAPFGARSEILRQGSPKAADHFAEGALDFCFIDGRHEYEAVKNDLEAWYPKVKQGGVLAGHDYVNGKVDGISYGVKTAVDEFCSARGLKKVLAHEPRAPSWFVFK